VNIELRFFPSFHFYEPLGFNFKLNYANSFYNWHVRTQIRGMDVHGRMVQTVKLLSELKKN